MRAATFLFAFAILAAVGPIASLRADQDAAMYLVEEGDDYRKRKRFEKAVASYREALEEMETCIPARFGLGEALLALEKTKKAVIAFRRVVRDGEAKGVPAAWKKLVPTARLRLEAHDALGKELDRMVTTYVGKLVRLATKYRTKDPDLADRCLTAALALRPEDTRATRLRDEMASKGTRREALFDGKQIEDWDGGRSDWWSVKDGRIVAETKGLASYIRTQEAQEGDYDIILEARIDETYDGSPFVALMGAWTAEYKHSRFGVLGDSVTWIEYFGKDDDERVFKKRGRDLKPKVDPREWVAYELRFRKKYIHAVVNGRELHKIERTDDRRSGYVGILAQDCRLLVRKVEIRRR